LDKFEYKIRAEEIKSLIAQGLYAEAAEIADMIDWRRVKSVMMLCTISDLYKINRRFDEARDMLLLAFDRHPGGRTIVYSLCELSIKMEEFVQAVEYYKAFVQIAPKDTGRYILQYKLYEAQDVSLEERIAVLEEFKDKDYREKWAYELAYLYHRVGLATRCVEECDELILWFGEGKYVIKALELKMLHEPLKPEQQIIYDNRFNTEPVEEDIITEPTYQLPVEEMHIQVKTMDVGHYNTINLQKELAEGLKEVLETPRQINADTDELDTIQIEEIDEESLVQEEIEGYEVYFGEAEAPREDYLPKELPRPIIRQEVKPDKGYQQNKDMRELHPIDPNPIDENTSEQITSSKFADAAVDAVHVVIAADAPMDATVLVEAAGIASSTPYTNDDISDTVMSELRKVHMEQSSLPPKMADVLSMESDGQIRLVLPAEERVEKQITGQLSIDDILAEWERMKKEREIKSKEEIRRHVLEQTGPMFTEFEASIRDGFLEKLENQIELAEEPSEQREPVEGDFDLMGLEISEAAWMRKRTDEEKKAALGVLYETGEIQYEELEAALKQIDNARKAVTDQEVISQMNSSDSEVRVVLPDHSEEGEIPEATNEPGEAEIPEATNEPEERAIPEVMNEPEEPGEPAVARDEEVFGDEESSSEPGESAEFEIPSDSEVPDEPDYPSYWEDTGEIQIPNESHIESARNLTKEEKELYASYVQSKAAREQLAQALDAYSMDAAEGNVIITGEDGLDTLTLAKSMIRQMQESDTPLTGKVVTISGEALNRKDVETLVDQAAQGALIIKKASEMNKETVEMLCDALEQQSLGILIFMEDTKKAMDRLLDSIPSLYNYFHARIDIATMSNDTLVAFGRKYAKELEFSIDELGILALHTRISDLQTSEHVVTVLEVRDIIDEAIHHVKRKTPGHFVDVLLAKRYDENDMIILREKDFIR
jgi:tetratricopeptide (TPR) repeat protein